MKMFVCEMNILVYYDTKKEVTIQVDARKYGLGAGLLKEDCQVAFTLKTLTLVNNYNTNIDCELFVVVFGA